MNTYLVTLVAAMAVFAPNESFADQRNLVQNGSFESLSISPWVSSGSGLFAGYESAADGRNFANIGGYLYQDLATTSGQTYHLRYAMAGNMNWPGLITMYALWGNDNVATTIWNPAGHNINNLGWIYTDLDLVASTTRTRLIFQNPGQFNQQPFLDAVSVVVVPEPSSAALLAALLVSLRIATIVNRKSRMKRNA